jgi:hypothetical protein
MIINQWDYGVTATQRAFNPSVIGSNPISPTNIQAQ